MNYYRSKEEDIKYFEEKAKYKRYCKNCGHSLYIVNKSGRAECTYCHNFVFADDKTEFMYRMKENLLREKRNNK